MVLDWPKEACQQHHQAGSDLESTGEEKEGKTKKHISRHRGKNAEKQSLLEGAGGDNQESGVRVDCSTWPMLPMGLKT